ncbi:hypothetical protein CEXT_36121 [Caerostris extrusa]|uniref:Uncharacterized protein n=1 Tax=Caerostris extrusa TaxID=172846 RepID=A0AAV4MGV4_CAEEX|nr:hypothetical protein CEXT_36121 [Caerostris extrusa]
MKRVEQACCTCSDSTGICSALWTLVLEDFKKRDKKGSPLHKTHQKCSDFPPRQTIQRLVGQVVCSWDSSSSSSSSSSAASEFSSFYSVERIGQNS